MSRGDGARVGECVSVAHPVGSRAGGAERTTRATGHSSLLAARDRRSQARRQKLRAHPTGRCRNAQMHAEHVVCAARRGRSRTFALNMRYDRVIDVRSVSHSGIEFIAGCARCCSTYEVELVIKRLAGGPR